MFSLKFFLDYGELSSQEPIIIPPIWPYRRFQDTPPRGTETVSIGTVSASHPDGRIPGIEAASLSNLLKPEITSAADGDQTKYPRRITCWDFYLPFFRALGCAPLLQGDSVQTEASFWEVQSHLPHRRRRNMHRSFLRHWLVESVSPQRR